MKKLTHRTVRKGFTLVETIVVVSVFTILMAAIATTAVNFYRTNDYAIQQSQAIAGGRQGIDKLVKDLRETTLSDEGDYPLKTIDNYEIEFYSDIDLDNSVEFVRYSINEFDQLIKEEYEFNGIDYNITKTTFLSEYVRNKTFLSNGDIGVSMFTYFDVNGTQITDFSDLDAVRYVKVEIIVNVNPERQPEEFVILSSASLRNLPVVE